MVLDRLCTGWQLLSAACAFGMGGFLPPLADGSLSCGGALEDDATLEDSTLFVLQDIGQWRTFSDTLFVIRFKEFGSGGVHSAATDTTSWPSPLVTLPAFLSALLWVDLH